MECQLPFGFRPERRSHAYVQWGKSFLDIVVSVTLLIMLIPLIGLVAIAVWLSSSGPIIFRQKRLGQSGKTFHMYKFRSMRGGEECNRLGTLEHDRVTRVGRFLRQTHLDELPQFVNVLLGQMSLVGPRPLPLPHHAQAQAYDSEFAKRLSAKPGITGLAQIQKDHRWLIERVTALTHLDLLYIRSTSLRNDITILFYTVAVILRRHGH